MFRFGEFGQPTEAEEAAIRSVAGYPRLIPRGRRVRAQGEPRSGFYLLADGWVAAAQIRPNGDRQIFKVHLPGDALGTPSMCYSHAIEELTALTDVVVMEVSSARFSKLFETHPRVTMRFLLSIQLERQAVADQLASMGRTSAERRIAAFLLDLAKRLEPLGLVQDGNFEMRMTQEEIGDVIGLTAVHTNRCLQRIQRQGLIQRKGSRYRLVDQRGLLSLAGREVRRPELKMDWMPPATA